jgi:hypothetical protein
MILIPLHTDASPAVRAEFAVEGLALILDELDELLELRALTPEHLRKIDEADTHLGMLRTGMQMRKSLSNLCSQFGRAP